MKRWKLGEIRERCGRQAQIIGGEEDRIASGVSIDTRTLKPGDLFVALAGESRDGHRYVREAWAKGAAAALVKRAWSQEAETSCAGTMIAVDDPLASLQHWATAERIRSSYRLVAVTGSTGKTTVREMIFAVLSQHLRAERSEGNFNNHIGVPLSLLSFSENCEAAVIELGANHLGEIDFLSRMAQPDAAVITNVGYGHVGLFGSIENTAKAKFEIRNGLKAEGILILNGDDPLLRKEAQRVQAACRFVSTHDASAFVFAENISLDASALASFSVQGNAFRLCIPGLHAVSNALAAISVGMALGVPLSAAALGLSQFKNIEGRWSEQRVTDILLIDDAYNANPSSLAASLETFSCMKIRGRRFAVLGDMLELGKYSEAMHFELGRTAMAKRVDVLCLLGDFSSFTQEGARKAGAKPDQCRVFKNRDEIRDFLAGQLQAGDAVLFKGSHRMMLSALSREVQAKLAAKNIQAKAKGKKNSPFAFTL